MPLHLKYRPNEFPDFLGNPQLVASLRSVIRRRPKDIPRSFLFSGPSGCGKTTLARLTARELGISSHDLREVDSADFRGIDTVRDLRRTMMLQPLSGKYRGWILDEVHQMTKDAQSALLKALEDTPKHAFFFLATTDPQKLLPTIVNRCTQFQVSPMSEEAMTDLVKKVVEAEGKELPEKVLKKVVEVAAGSPRLALVSLDKIIDLPEEDQMEAVDKAVAEANQAIDLCRALIARKKWGEIAAILRGLNDQDPETVRRIMLGYANAILLKKDDPQAFLILDSFKEPFYNTGFPGLTAACYSVLNG